MKYQILHGDNRVTLKTLADNSVDAIVTDPPYGIDFLGKAWDANTGALETYQQCLRVLKPGGHILAFSAARTYHHLAITLEQAGFEIRDQIMWIYSSGFPKSQDIGKSIDRAAGKKDPNYKANNFNATSTEGKGFPGQTCVKCNLTLTKCVDTTKSTVGKCKEEDCAQKYKAQTDEGKAWSGWGTQLKPAHEPIALARKPLGKGHSIARNCQTHGVGALNIDATRIAYDDPAEAAADAAWRAKWSQHNVAGPVFQDQDIAQVRKQQGKSDLDQANSEVLVKDEHEDRGNWEPSQIGRFPSNVIGEIPLYQKYFYCPKVSRAERHVGMEDIKSDPQTAKKGNGIQRVCETCGTPQMQAQNCLCAVKSWVMPTVNGGNNHPTVKPIELMKYLIRLITPPGGTVLDPFSGSGSTGCAAVELGMTYIGCELDERYVAIARRRIDAWYQQCNPNTYNQLFVA